MTVARGAGFTLLEVLITLIVLAVGMLGLASLQSKIHITEIESYQRAHAVLLLQDMVDRINANRPNAASYASATMLGTFTSEDCSAPATLAAQDRCAWSTELLGAAETSGGANAGGMIGARGCIDLVQAANPASGVCTPGIYRISVAWQGLVPTVAQAGLACATGQYKNASGATDDTLRRVISTQISIGLPTCN